MVSITPWMEEFTAAVRAAFGERVYCIGLQGSYGPGRGWPGQRHRRGGHPGPAHPPGHQGLPGPFSCPPPPGRGLRFLSGKGELLGWEPSDLFQFYHDTTPVWGSLDELLPRIGPEDVDRAVCIGACNIYHMCVHNMLHEQDPSILKGLYKSAAFVLQAKHFGVTGQYLRRQGDLLPLLSPEDRGILEISLALKKRALAEGELEPLSERLFLWAGALIRKGA